MSARAEVRDVIARAIWRRVTRDNQNGINWGDLYPVDTEEFYADADAVLDALAEGGFVLFQRIDYYPDAVREAQQ